MNLQDNLIIFYRYVIDLISGSGCLLFSYIVFLYLAFFKKG